MPKHHHPDGEEKHPPKPPRKDNEHHLPKPPHKDKEHKHSVKECLDELDIHSLNDVLFDLIKSVADEEEALALLIRAEADKIQAFIGKHCNFPTKPSNKEILDLNRSVTQMLETIVMKEFLLLKKLEKTLEVIREPREECEDED